MSLAFNAGVIPFSGRRKQIFPAVVQGCSIVTKNSSSFTAKCTLTITDLLGKIEEKFKGTNSCVAVETVEAADIPSYLCIIDTLQRLGVNRHFQSEIKTILDNTYMLWQQKHRDVYSNVTTLAMAFRLLRLKGYHVSSEELAPYADEEHVKLQTIDVQTVIELYRAAQMRTYDEESSLGKLHAWTAAFLNHQLQTNSIADQKLHKLVEYYLKNYNRILDRIEVRQTLDLYDIHHYQTLRAADRFCNLRNEDFLAFARQDFNICQAQHQQELQQLQRWNEDCRFDTLKFGRDVVCIAHFMNSAIHGDPELSDVRLICAKLFVLFTRMDDFFDHHGSREESYKILELVKEWKEKPAAEYGSEEVEILFTALYNTVNEYAEMAHVEQGRSVKEFLIKLWVEILSSTKIELDTWSDDTALTLDEYLFSSTTSIACRLIILTSMQFLGVKISDEMLLSEECTDLCWHVAVVNRLLNDVQTFEKERNERKENSVTILLATRNDDGKGVTEEEAIREIKELVEYNRRKLMQILYKKDSIFPRQCRDMFLKFSTLGHYVYASGDEYSSPQQQMMQDMKSLLHKPLSLL